MSLQRLLCCCKPPSVECRCPVDTITPSSVVATIEITDCCGNQTTIQAILAYNKFTCAACLSCPKYGWNPNVLVGNSCSGFSCESVGQISCSTDCSATGTALMGSITLGTDTFSEGGYCTNWIFNTTIESVIANDPNINFQATRFTLDDKFPDSCVICEGAYACMSYQGCDKTTVGLCKHGSKSPIGVYTVCGGDFSVCAGTGCMDVKVMIS